MRSILPLFAFGLTLAVPAAAAEIVPVPAFRSVELRGGGSVELRRGPVQRVTLVQGSTRYTKLRVTRSGTLEIDACSRRCPRNFDLDIVIESPRVPDVAITAGGAITAAPGFAPQRQLSAAVRAGGTIDLRSVRATNVSAAVHAGGSIRVHAQSSLAAAVTAGGTIAYRGNPAVSSAINAGGSVIRDN